MENYKDQEEIYSNKVRAGKRTYFFDVRATKADDYYLTITESKKIFDDNGNQSFKKHKIFLYKEDFEKFQNALADTLSYIIKNKGLDIISTESEEKSETKTEEKSFTDVNFEDI
ncbi:PUR family DNA/RNA-binding protein [Flavobacteriales bacterium]|nr:PUR family DNA/RNA-binding protein [Flavobacteriales bacterium]